MAIAQVALQHLNESPEIKKPLQYRDVDESLSEWELARRTSKTWSMEQE